MVLVMGLAVLALLIWQFRARGAVSTASPEGRVHVDRLLSAADVLSWDEPEVRERVALSDADPAEYFERYGDAFGRAVDVWPFAALDARGRGSRTARSRGSRPRSPARGTRWAGSPGGEVLPAT